MPWKPKIVSMPVEPKIIKVKPFHKVYGPYAHSKSKEPKNVNINTGEWVKGVYDNIDVHPIKIESKSHLIHECEKRGLVAKAFMKRKSQGKGIEHARR